MTEGLFLTTQPAAVMQASLSPSLSPSPSLSFSLSLSLSLSSLCLYCLFHLLVISSLNSPTYKQCFPFCLSCAAPPLLSFLLHLLIFSYSSSLVFRARVAVTLHWCYQRSCFTVGPKDGYDGSCPLHWCYLPKGQPLINAACASQGEIKSRATLALKFCFLGCHLKIML